MKHKKLIIIAATASVLLLVLKSMIVTNGGLEQGYKASDLAPFHRATQWTLFSVGPLLGNETLSDQGSSRGASSPTGQSTGPAEKIAVTESFHGYAILKQHTVTVSPELLSVLTELESAAQHWKGSSARCFIPRHALRVIEQGTSYDLLICYECKSAEIYQDGSHTGTIYFSTVLPNAAKPDQLNILLK